MWRSKEKSLAAAFSSKKMMEYQIPRQGSIGSQFEWHWDVYLDDADDCYFWFCEKIFTRKKLGHSEKYKKYFLTHETVLASRHYCHVGSWIPC